MEIVTSLLSAGADVMLVSSAGQTPLHNVCNNYTVYKGKALKDLGHFPHQSAYR